MRRLLLLLLVIAVAPGCAALTNPVAAALPVRKVPAELLAPSCSNEVPLPLSLLTLPAENAYHVYPGDQLGIYIEGVVGFPNQAPPLQVNAVPVPRDQRRPPSSVGYPIPVEPDGKISLPQIDPIQVAGLTTVEIRRKLQEEYTRKRAILQAGNDRIFVSVLQPRMVHVLVLRQETLDFSPGPDSGNIALNRRGSAQILELGATENDILHALTISGGLPGVDAYNKVCVYRNGFRTPIEARADAQQFCQQGVPSFVNSPAVIIPLRVPRDMPMNIPVEAVTLNEGDIVYLEARNGDTYFTGGLLPSGEHLLPRDRSLDILQAISAVRGPILNGAVSTNNLAGNLITPGIGNPSPSLLVVIRQTPNNGQIAIRVDLNDALCDARERINVQPGDVLLLQETPDEALARYFSTSFFNFSYSLQALRSATGFGVLNLNTPQNVPGSVITTYQR